MFLYCTFEGPAALGAAAATVTGAAAATGVCLSGTGLVLQPSIQHDKQTCRMYIVDVSFHLGLGARCLGSFGAEYFSASLESALFNKHSIRSCSY